jgi:adenylate cyclase
MRDNSPICATIYAATAEGLSSEVIDRRVWERHGTVRAMLALDSSGMTRVTRGLGIVHFLTRYLQMRDVAEAILQRHGCTNWRSFADNLFAEFNDADTALNVAREIHATLHERKVMLTHDEPYRVCIGIGYGRVLDNGALGVMGDEMNLVAKLAEDVAEAGQTLLSDAAFRSLRESSRVPVELKHLNISGVDVTYHRLR